MRDLDAIDGAEEFTAAQVEYQNLMSGLCGSKKPVPRKVDTKVIEPAMDRSRHIQLLDKFEGRDVDWACVPAAIPAMKTAATIDINLDILPLDILPFLSTSTVTML